MSTPSDVALALAGVALTEAPAVLARACVDALRPLLGRARIVLPPSPIPVVAGDSPDGLAPLVRFPAVGGDGELWSAPDVLSPETHRALQAQLERIWAVQYERSARAGELDQLRFHLAALQQVAHTLAVVRGVEETGTLALDSIKEVFFAWWATLYRANDDGELVCQVARTMRREVIASVVPPDAARMVLAGGSRTPSAPPEEDPIRRYFPADLAVLAPLDLGESRSGLLALGPRMTEAPYEAHDLALLRALADASAIALRNAELVDQLRTQAIRDALTGCQNRRGFDERLDLELARSRRYGRSLSIVLIDIDFFKKVNDDLGHDAGDHALRRVGKLLRTGFRMTDVPCRIGGEEFALLFPETPKSESVHLAERVRLGIESIEPDEILPRAITASVGVAAYPDDADDAEELLRAADRALYQAKASGRNRVVVAGTEPGPA